MRFVSASLFSATLLAALGLSSCASTSSVRSPATSSASPTRTEPVGKTAEDAKVQAFVHGTNSFGLTVFKKLAATSNNALYSPVSMNSALSMVGHYADEKSQLKMLRAMGMSSLSIAEFNAANAKVFASFAQSSDTYSIALANSFWVDRDYKVEAAGKVVEGAQIYGATPNNDYSFKGNAADKMNAWVKSATHDKIDKLVTQEEVAPLHWAAISAIYFDGKWLKKFGNGYKSEFVTSSGKEVSAFYIEAAPGEGVLAIPGPEQNIYELSYGTKGTTDHPAVLNGRMIIIQPKEPVKLKTLVESMSAEKLNDIQKQFADQRKLGQRGNYAVNIPAFELSGETGMEPVKFALVAAGAGDFFRGFDMTSLNPNFTDQNENKIRIIKQKATITVANTGTVAAAASFVGGGIESMGPQSLYVNSAFLYLIVDNDTGALLFAGTVDTTEGLTVPEMK